MIDCGQVKELLLLAADDELQPEQFASLEIHMKGCEPCRIAQSRFRQIDRDLREYREQLFRPDPSRARPWIAPAAGAVAASVVAAALLFHEPTAPPKPRLDDRAFVAIPYTVPLAPYE